MDDEIEYKGHTIKVEQDDLIEDPLEYCTEIGITYLRSSRYILGNVPVNDPQEWRTEKLRELAKKRPGVKKADLMFEYPVYAYIHSGVVLAMSPFSCQWDSGQSGVIYMSRADAAQWFQRKFKDPELESLVKPMLKSTLETFNQFISGEVYYYRIEDSDGEEVDGCGGFYGSDHEKSGLLTAARETIDSLQ